MAEVVGVRGRIVSAMAMSPLKLVEEIVGGVES
jgi:hypothetical protein